MDRRKFIKQSSLAGGGVLISSSVLSFPQKQTLSSDKKVLIIGAGAAGLYAGYTLHKQGIDFTILEASNRIGGRLGKREDFADFPIDLGAQWLHGKKSIAGKLVKKKGVAITEDESELAYWFTGKMRQELPKDVVSIVQGDRNSPDISYREYAKQQGLGDEYRFIVEQIAGDYGADSNDMSVKWTAVEEYDWSSGNKDYKFERTYFDLINDHITAYIEDKVLLETIVSKIKYNEKKVVVTDKSGREYEADKLLITVPIPILQQADIEFSPQLPKEKTDAFQKIGMGAGMKVFLKFKEKFYDENIIGGPICAAYADETVGKNGKDHVLLAFVMGKQAEYLSSLGSPASICRELLAELDDMYQGKASASFAGIHVEDWGQNPFIKGAYSYSKVGIGNARNIAAQAVSDKLFFAGEAMNLNGHHATVHGAMETGYEQALKIADLL